MTTMTITQEKLNDTADYLHIDRHHAHKLVAALGITIQQDPPDDALLWSRERVAALAPPTWPEWAAQVRAGRHDDLPEVAEHADAFRAGQAHADAAMLWRDIADMPENQPVLAVFLRMVL